jgi:tripartite-type tricarboxylate transporter receptor subunit TctC
MSIVRASLTALLLVIASSANLVAAAYPERPITVVVGFPPGSAPDVAARLVTPKLSARLGQPVIVENRSGASGTIAAGVVAHARPDGYTLFFSSASTMTVAPALYKNLPFEGIGSFSPIVQIVRGPFILTVRSALPVHNVKELADYAHQRPGELTYGSSGNGSLHQLCMEMLKSAAGLDIKHIPYRGSPPNWLAFNAGEVDMICDSMPNPTLSIESGKGRAIAVTGDRHVSSIERTPTFKEQGFGQVSIEFWYGFLAPKGTPKDVIDKLNSEIAQAVNDAEITDRFRSQDLNVLTGTPEEFGKMIAAEAAVWPPIVAKLNMTLD